jgi:hypothetical protein
MSCVDRICNWVAMNCTVYAMRCNFAIHATCSLTFMAYKYSALQVSSTIQKLRCETNCKTPFFHSVTPIS